MANYCYVVLSYIPSLLFVHALTLETKQNNEFQWDFGSTPSNNNTVRQEFRDSELVLEGEICNIDKYPVPGEVPEYFFMCRMPDVDSTIWPWTGIGVWTKMRCLEGNWFSPETRMCRRPSSVRRQQRSYCRRNPSQCQQFNPCPAPPCPPPPPPPPPPAPICPQPPCIQPRPQCVQPPCQQQCQPQQQQCPRPCPMAANSGSGQRGGMCSWMMAPLIPDGSSKGFLQCVPKQGGEYCGRWMSRPCAPGTRFDGRLQVCVHDENACGGQLPVGPCNARQQCPGRAVCQMPMNTCCNNRYF